MRVATWNVNGLRARLSFVLGWLRARAPDVVALQELKLSDDKFPHEAFAELGYHAVAHGQKAWNGVAILGRRPPVPEQLGLPGQEELGARFVVARCGELSFASVYCPNGKTTEHPDFPRKLAWLEALADHLSRQRDPARPLVVGGDFNVCPTALDSWNEKGFHGSIFHTDEERERFAALLDWGLVDLYRERHREGRDFSWWDYRGGAFHRDEGLRIDFLLATAPVAVRLRSVRIDRDYRKKQEGQTASDHAPVIVELE